MNIKQNNILYILTVLLLVCLSIPMTSHLVEIGAIARANKIIAPLKGKTEHETIVNVSKWAAQNFAHVPPYTHWASHTLIAHYTNLLSHRFLPSVIRLPRGTIEMYTMEGQCSHLSKLLELLFSVAGIESEQHDIFSPTAGHSALSVKNNGEWVFIDPFLGLLLMDNGKLLSLEKAQQLVREGMAIENFIVPLREKMDFKFYQELANFNHSRMSEKITLNINLDFNDSNIIQVGEIDGQYKDVLRDGPQHRLSSHLHYVGPRYRRNLTHVFNLNPVAAPNGYKVIFHTTEQINPNHLPKSNIPPTIDGNKLIYSVNNSNTLNLFYGDMGWNIERILKRKSWYDTDMVEFVRL